MLCYGCRILGHFASLEMLLALRTMRLSSFLYRLVFALFALLSHKVFNSFWYVVGL